MPPNSILDTLLNLLSPTEAQAKIRGTSEAMDLVSNLWADAERNRSQYLPDMYSRIYRAADARPQEVHMSPEPGLYDKGALGEYRRTTSGHKIVYDPEPKEEFRGSLPNTIPHELIHFLDQTGGRPQKAPVQHDLIYQLIGGALTKPGAIGVSPEPFTPMEQSILEYWLQSNPRATER